MKIQVKHSGIIDFKFWDSKLLENDSSTVYQTASWPLVYSVYDSKPIYISTVNQKGDLVGQLAVIIHTKLFWKYSSSLVKFFGNKLKPIKILYWSYGPIIHDKENFNIILNEILVYLDKLSKENNITMIHGTTPPLETKFQPKIFQENNYRYRPWGTYIIDLKQDPNLLYKSLNKKVRYDIRKSDNENFEFEIVSKRKSFDDFMKMRFEEKVQSGKKAILDKNIYDSHWKHLYKNGYEKAFIIRQNETPIGGINNLIFNGNIVQQNVVNLTSKQKLGGSFLTWKTIDWSVNQKLVNYDMGGFNPNPSSEKEKQIDYFKKKWGGKPYKFGSYTKVLDKTKFKILSAIKDPKRISGEINRLISNIT